MLGNGWNNETIKSILKGLTLENKFGRELA
jgi:hypothetical protein